jgi:hypothetical protein
MPVARRLIISDLHAPYQHPDALRFLAALQGKYDFDGISCVGDELDYHAMSFHDSDPDLDAAGRELQAGREVLWELETLFPQMDLCDSNHGSMLYRRGMAAGVPRHLLLSYQDAIFAVKKRDGSIHRPKNRGNGWRWHHSFAFSLDSRRRCVMRHGMSISTRRNVEQSGMSFVQGHHHGTFEVVYNGTPDALNWGMTVGCLIDDGSLAFAYNRNTLRRPVIGCGGIIDGQPRLFPMVLARGGRWTGVVP